LKGGGFVPILAAMHLLLTVVGYLLAAVLIAHAIYFAGCLVVMTVCAVTAPFVWAWQRLRA
jgi:hypothetical protein